MGGPAIIAGELSSVFIKRIPLPLVNGFLREARYVGGRVYSFRGASRVRGHVSKIGSPVLRYNK